MGVSLLGLAESRAGRVLKGSQPLSASGSAPVGACGEESLGGDSSVALADLVRWGDWGCFSPLAVLTVLGLFPYRHVAASPAECVWVCDIFSLGSDSYFATDWLGEFAQTI